MARKGWKQLLTGTSWYCRPKRFPITAYSEFMPPPRLGCKPYGSHDPVLFQSSDPFGWNVTEYEETMELRPGLERLASQLVRVVEHLGAGRPAHGIARQKLEGNPYWPAELASHAGRLPHERYVVIAPLALSRTQDDKGRVRWTLFGGSEHGPAKAFWKGFFTAPGKELAADAALGFFRRLLAAAYGLPPEQLHDLHKAGFRILPGLGDSSLPYSQDEPLPLWTEPYLLADDSPLRGVRYLLTFRPFGSLPKTVRRAYLAGRLALLPFPGSLVFWGEPPLLRLRHDLPLAMQIPLLNVFERHEAPNSIRVPQSGWMHEPRADHPEPYRGELRLRNTYRRTHRWARVQRDEDELAVAADEDSVAHVLFSVNPDDLGLYGKPMARNAQIWTHDFRLLLDGPRAAVKSLQQAAEALREGGLFGYRFVFPAMQVGRHEVYWHRPLVACLAARTSTPEVVPHAPLGYMTAYAVARPDTDRPVELWPRILARQPHVESLYGFSPTPGRHEHHTSIHNVRKVLESSELWGDEPLPADFARSLLTVPHEQTLEDWLRHIECSTNHAPAGSVLTTDLRRRIAPSSSLPPSLTYHRTATRTFEAAYWRTIMRLALGAYIQKCNGDCARDPISRSLEKHHHRDLEALGDYLLDYYRRLAAKHGMDGCAIVGDSTFHWKTQFPFAWLDGWLGNQESRVEERDLLVIIPGRDRSRAIIMADHYDTAYMEDCYEKARGGNGARLAAAGADDNHSATAALMLGAPVFMDLSRKGRLACDIWLVHLTGEEFPSDCMGARHLAQGIVERSLQVRCQAARKPDLSKVQIDGIYVLDMIAHNNEHDPDVFQISPGTGRDSLRLAYHAHVANAIWNAGVPAWNGRAARRGCQRGRRSGDGKSLPATALHPLLQGEVRPPHDPRSSLYNTDGQIFSDAGIPAVLFMENYDINRTGYHDTQDNMTNIDLDYGAAVAAIAIETVARAASGDNV